MTKLFLISVFYFGTFLPLSSQNDSITKTVEKEGNKFSFYCKYDINYPAEAKEKKIEGEVMLSFDVDSACTLMNKKVVKGLGYGCDEEALRILNEYEACLKKANAYKCEPIEGFVMPVKFKLPVKK